MFRRTMQIERLESRATPAVLLADGFASLAFDPVFWDTATLATVASTPAAASTPLAARFNGNTSGGDELRSVALPLAGATTATLSYEFARTATGSRPQTGEDLVVEMRTDGGDWTEVARHLATDPEMAAMARRALTVSLSEGAATLQLRFRHLGTRSQLGDYWVDDVTLVTGDAEVAGRLWFDRDENAASDAGELPLAGWTVFADLNRDGVRGEGEPSAVTDAEGNYTLADLPPGDYAIRPDMPVGWYGVGPRRDQLVPRGKTDAGDVPELAGTRAVVASSDGRHVYAAADDVGAIVALERAADGQLSVLHTETGQSSGGRLNGGQGLAGVAALALSPDGRSLYAALGDSDAIVAFDRDSASGEIAWRRTLAAAEVGAPFEFPSALLVSPDGRQLYVAASNSASVLTLARDPATGDLSAGESFALSGGGLAGASALAIGPDGRQLYVTASGDKAVVTLARDVATGRLSHVETLFDDTPQAGGLDGASAVAVSPDGRHVVVAGGFDDALALFRRDAQTGRLALGDVVVNGLSGVAALDGPQSVAFSPDGSMLFVAAINSDAVTAFRRDAATGALAPVAVLQSGSGVDAPMLDGVRSIAPLADGGVVAAAYHASSVASFVVDAAQANLTLVNGQRATAVDFGLSRDAARWKGAGGDAFWSTATNWHGNVPPLDGEAVTIDAAGALVETVNDLGEEHAIAALTLSGVGVTVTGDGLAFAAGGDASRPAIAAMGGPHYVTTDVRFADAARVALGDTETSEPGEPGELIVAGTVDGLAVTIAGLGRAELAGDVTLTGRLTVESGTVQVDGAFTAADVLVATDATLAGKGVVASAVVVESDAQLSPGATAVTPPPAGPAANAAANVAAAASNSAGATTTVGTITSGDLTLSGNATLAIDIVADEVSAAHDAVAVAGTVSIDGANLSFALAGRLPLDVEYVLVDNDGTDPIVGQFTDAVEGAFFEIDGQRFRLSYIGGDGNDISIYAPPTGEVFGRVWHDANANRALDEGESLLAAQTVFADVNGNGAFDAGEPTAVTDASGDYHLTQVPVGRTRILPLVENGWQATTPAPLDHVIRYVATMASETGGASPRLDGVRSLAVSPDGRHVYAVANNDDTLVALRRDAYDGQLTFAVEVRDGVDGVNGLNGARGVATSRDGRHVYVAGYFDDAVAVFARDAASGGLTFVQATLDNTAGVDGLDGATAVVVSPDDRFVYVAGYLDDAVAVFARDAATGQLTHQSRVRNATAGVVGLDGVHGLSISPDGKHLYAASATDNALAVFRRDAATGALTFAAAYVDGQNNVTTLGVARSVAVSPDGRFVFVAAELDNAVTTFRRDAATGALALASTARSANGVAGLIGPTSLAVSADGERLYVASSGDDAVAVFDIDRTTGALAYREHLAHPVTPGLDGAAAVVLAPDGDHIYVAGQNADSIVFAARILPSDVVVLAPGEIVTGIDHGVVNPPPRVVAIAARSSGWSTTFTASLNADANGVAGLPLAEGEVHRSIYPGIDEFVVRFNEDVAPRSADLAVFGAAQPTYRPTLVAYDAATYTATWRLFAPVDADKLLVRVSAELTDAGGATLGSDVERRLDVLGGSTSGQPVAEADLARVAAAMFTRIGMTAYDAAADLNGDGLVNYVDAILARNLVGSALPAGQPAPTSTPLPPAVAGVFLDGSAWSAAFRQSLADVQAGDAVLGWRLAAGDGAADVVPWTTVDQVHVRFTDAVAVAELDLNVVSGGATFGASGFSYDAATYTATWTLAAPLAAGDWTLAVDDGVASLLGAKLDGELTATPRWPSGDGMPGGAFGVAATVAPGDLDRDGAASDADAAAVRAALFSAVGSAIYDPRADIDANGLVNVVDLILLRNVLGRPPVDEAHAAPPVLVVAAADRGTVAYAAPPALVVSAGNRAASAQALVAGVSSRKAATERPWPAPIASSAREAVAAARRRSYASATDRALAELEVGDSRLEVRAKRLAVRGS